MKKPPYLESSHPPGRSQESAQRTGQDSPGKSAELRAAGRMRRSSGGPGGERAFQAGSARPWRGEAACAAQRE